MRLGPPLERKGGKKEEEITAAVTRTHHLRSPFRVRNNRKKREKEEGREGGRWRIPLWPQRSLEWTHLLFTIMDTERKKKEKKREEGRERNSKARGCACVPLYPFLLTLILASQ